VGTISQDLSAAGMTAAIGASWTGAFEQRGRSPRVQVHEEPDLRLYVTPGVPIALFNHAHHTRLAREEHRTVASSDATRSAGRSSASSLGWVTADG
jgi:hypothetical protein